LQIDVEKCYVRYGPFVLRRCRELLRNEEEALDAMQETFIKLIRYSDSLEPNALAGLLHRIATNVCLNIVRTKQYKTKYSHPDVLLEIAGSDDTEKKVWVKDLIDRLFEREKDTTKAIAVYHYVDGMTYEEIASETGLSVSGIRKRLRTLKERALAIGGSI
jgi:RNA polymerase sigma-70 factor (ECF subfamily)